jgi:predicted dehydrogenase
MDAAFQDRSFDLINICLPIRLHSEYVLRALKAGSHALVELPLADQPGRRAAGGRGRRAQRQPGVR